MRETLAVAGLVVLLVLCTFGAMTFSSYATPNEASVSPLGDGGGPPIPVSPNVTLAGDPGGPPVPVDTRQS